jgi:hypothetical protein
MFFHVTAYAAVPNYTTTRIKESSNVRKNAGAGCKPAPAKGLVLAFDKFPGFPIHMFFHVTAYAAVPNYTTTRIKESSNVGSSLRIRSYKWHAARKEA